MFVIVLTTLEKREDGEKIGAALVERRLAACVQILGPITSIYRWKGRVEKSGEFLCLIKTKQSLYSEVEAFLKENHPYEVPQIVAIPISQGSEAYLKWLEESCTG